jgi:RNA polymerase sigma-70 factor (ECF subfamily)
MSTDGTAENARLDADERRARFRVLYDDNAATVYRFVHRRCQDHSMAEDVTHDTFMTAVRTLEDPATVHVGWLITVARNRLFDLLRRESTRDRKLRLVSTAPDHDREDTALIERLRVEAALAKLSVGHRLVLSLHYLDAMTIDAIAAELGRTPKSVEALVTRARRNLRRELEENFDD